MLGKRLIGAVIAACMGASAISMPIAGAAEKSYAPWNAYFVQKSEIEDFSKYVKAEYEWAGGKAKLPSAGELQLTNRADGYTTIRPAADINGYQDKYGAAAIGFTAPADGSYEIYFYADNNINTPNNYKSIATVNFGKLDAAENKVVVFDTISVDGYNSDGNKETTYKKDIELKKGEELLTKIASTNDGYNRFMNVKYQIRDLTTYELYDYNNVGDCIIPNSASGKTEWGTADYRTLKTKDNSMWSLYLAGNIADAKDSENKWQDFSSWKAYPIEENRSAGNNGISIVNGETKLQLYDSRPNGWFWWRPGSDATSNGTGTIVIGWTAPEDGTYLFDVGGYNKGQSDAKSPESTNHIMAYRKANSEELVKLDNFDIPSARSETEANFKAQYIVEKGETIYFLSDCGTDGYGDSVDLRYVITNINDYSKTWSASNMYKQELSDSPFKYWHSKHGATDLSGYFASNMIFDSTWGCIKTTRTTGDNASNRLVINRTGTFEATPSSDTTDVGGNLAVTFDVPEDGFYKVEFDAKDSNAGANSSTPSALLYHLAGRAETIGTAIADTGRIESGVTSEIVKTISAKQGDKILLNINTTGDSYNIKLSGHYKITKFDKFNYNYTLGDEKITSVSQLKAGETFTATLNFLDDDAQSITLVTAVYNSEGTMTAIGVSEPVTTIGGSVTPVSASLIVPALSNGDVVRTFVVDGINTLVPINKAEQLKN